MPLPLFAAREARATSGWGEQGLVQMGWKSVEKLA